MKKIMILGSSFYFVNLVESAKEKGIYTIVCDNYENTPAKLICDEAIKFDIFNLEALEKLARDKQIDGIITGFSDLLMKPYVEIANRLGLPCVIMREQLNSVTDKSEMKDVFKKFNIESPKYCIINGINESDKIEELQFPVIMKPLDSSGSKGIYILQNKNDFGKFFNESKKLSTSGSVICEEFYESEEIQGMGWVKNGEVHVLYIGDRELVKIHSSRPGKPNRLIYPSKYCYQYEDEIRDIFQKVVEAFELKNGPLYIQMLVGKDGIKVAEAMPRLPGGCDYLLFRDICGFDAGKALIDFSVGNKINFEEIKSYKMRLDKSGFVIPIYLKEGKVEEIENLEMISNLDWVSRLMVNVNKGSEIKATGDMRQDCGRVFALGNNIYDANEKTKFLYEKIKVVDKDGNNLIDNF